MLCIPYRVCHFSWGYAGNFIPWTMNHSAEKKGCLQTWKHCCWLGRFVVISHILQLTRQHPLNYTVVVSTIYQANLVIYLFLLVLETIPTHQTLRESWLLEASFVVTFEPCLAGGASPFWQLRFVDIYVNFRGSNYDKRTTMDSVFENLSTHTHIYIQPSDPMTQT